MIYAGDLAIAYPVKDIYDTQMMMASIAAAKDMYEKGQLQIKDFYKDYGDFLSPILKDMEWYDQNVTGKVKDTINNLYANGIDPLRSAEGRAAISLLIYSMPTGNISKVRLSAEAAKEYIKNRGILEAAGKWDPNFERFANLGNMLEDWDTIGGNNVWTRTSPAEVKTLKELTEPWYNNRQIHALDKAGVESFGMKYDPRYEYMGFTDKDLLDIAAGQTPGWNGSIYADYYRDIAKRQLQANGNYNPTFADIERLLQRNIATANVEWMAKPVRQADAFAKLAAENQYKIGQENLRHKHAMDEASAKNKDNISGGYLNLISNLANRQLFEHNKHIYSDYIARNSNKYDKVMAIKDENLRNRELNKLQNDAFVSYLTRKQNGTSIYLKLMQLKPGQKGVSSLNGILSLRAVKGDQLLDAKDILPKSGFNKSDNGWYTVDDGKVLSAHTIMKNILAYDSKNDFTIKNADGTKTTRNDLIKKLSDVEKDDDLWIHASTAERTRRTGKVKPRTKGGGYIVAPNEDGIPTLYMKVAIQQEAKGWDIGSWLPQGEHEGYWVEVPVQYSPLGTISSNSSAVVYGLELQQRHEYGNAGSSQSYTDIRY